MKSDPDKTVLNPATTRARLLEWGHQPNRRLGQNFLVDGNIVRKSIALAALAPDEPVIEIGPGLGTLTAALLAERAVVHAVELDPRLSARLRLLFKAEIDGHRLSLEEGDCVARPTAGCPPDPRAKVVANLPYAATSPWIEALLHQDVLPARMVLMLQKEAADRLTAPCGCKNYGAITVLLQAAYVCSSRHSVSRQCFQPVPDVDSMLIVLDRTPTPRRLSPEAYQLVRAIFTRRRKQIGGIVRSTNNPALSNWLDGLARCHKIPPSSRAEAIPVAAWLELNSALPLR